MSGSFKNAGFKSSRAAARANGGTGPVAQTPSEKTVQFINAEVLDPPAQGDISFVAPFYQQTLVMALEDARSFVQGAEQILLVAMAKLLNKVIASAGAAEEMDQSHIAMAQEDPSDSDTAEATAEVAGSDGAPRAARPDQVRPARKATDIPPHLYGLETIERLTACAAGLHEKMAATASKYKGDF